MIKSFACKETQKVMLSRFSQKFPKEIQERSMNKLLLLDAASTICELRMPQSNHLKKLAGFKKGQYSIRINKQWRICFTWSENNAYEVEIIDYH